MYLEHFGFKEIPFSIAPDPRYLYMSERHREALAHLLFGIQADGGFVLLSGEVGTGKTTVCRCLLEQVPQETQIAFVLHPKLTPLELLATLCDELGVSYPEGSASVKLFVDRINERLLENHAQGKKTVLIIDEAQNLDPEVLEQIRLLTNLETNERKLLQVILLGQPELREKLARPELRQLAQRITARYHLEPLTRAETIAYLKHRLAVAGVRREVFTPCAVRRIYRLSDGVPRRINLLCDRSLLGAYVQGKEKVDGRIVSRAAQEVFDNGGRRLGRWAAAALVVAVAAVFFLWPHGARDVTTAPGLKSSVSVAVEASLDWPGGIPLDESRRLAYKALFEAWGIDVEAGDDPCRDAQERGYACLSRVDGLDALRRFNLPAVLALKTDRGETFFAALIGLSAERAIFRRASETVAVDLRELHKRWSGEYTLLWRRPPFQGVLTPGSRGAAVRWLAERLALLEGQTPPLETDPTLSGELLGQLKAFQFSRGLAPDGVVGPFTVILLDVAVGEAPLLRPDVEEL